ncbi:hypothetical protein R83H12_03029 [Fibrobacteria bacterium R8-3-H12]
MDVCCLNRPFDDLSQDRGRSCEKGKWTLVSSGAIDFELSKLPDIDRFEQIQTLYAVASDRIKLTEQTGKRAAFFQQNGIKPFDSLHLALAETGGVDVFLTTDDRLLRMAKKLNLTIKVDNPVSWLMEVMNNE